MATSTVVHILVYFPFPPSYAHVPPNQVPILIFRSRSDPEVVLQERRKFKRASSVSQYEYDTARPVLVASVGGARSEEESHICVVNPSSP
jgi:hypothetical protein